MVPSIHPPVKLIASDIDGTLLQNGERTLRPALFEEIERLSRCGVRFCAASGRQYPNLRRLFGPVWRELFYICENGALLAQGDRILSKTPLPADAAAEIVADVLAQPGCDVLISGAETSYLLPKSESFVTLIRDYVGNETRVVGSLSEIPEEIIKISAYCESGIAPHAPGFLQRWANRVSTVISGVGWLDFTCSDKGSGLMRLQEILGLRREELMAFGDNDNDVTMLRAAGTSYAMCTASERAREAAGRQTGRVETVLAQLWPEPKAARQTKTERSDAR